MNGVAIGPVIVGRAGPLTVIAGPCQLEDCPQAIEIAGHVAQICAGLGMGYIFKASFDKANRTSISGTRGPGIEAGLRMLAEVRETVGCPVLTDVHLPEQCAPVAEVAHVLQIPAFLCRQTDLLLAAGQTGAAVNIKKGQFLAPWDVAHAAEKVASTRNARSLLTERGTSFGYNTLVADMRSLEVMAETGYPVIFDATHAVQMPGGAGASSSLNVALLHHWLERLLLWALPAFFWRPIPTPTPRRAMARTWCRLATWSRFWRSFNGSPKRQI